ncbi:hypothetical protein BDV26DRAFT_261985 [Aspergillus bertholletiae]|uniref:Uncharacterized protein n=1 Tax=Aspergillus bertholletiae TaxID=1226010 RepID=A0A5N7B8X2_9EURO|nr:hypothetical protein BDV26DRAFT_261985 [Aspergillus bertholletiae]
MKPEKSIDLVVEISPFLCFMEPLSLSLFPFFSFSFFLFFIFFIFLSSARQPYNSIPRSEPACTGCRESIIATISIRFLNNGNCIRHLLVIMALLTMKRLLNNYSVVVDVLYRMQDR